MWRVVYTLLLVSTTSLGSPLTFQSEVPVSELPESEVRYDPTAPDMISPSLNTASSLTFDHLTGSDVAKDLRTQLAMPEVRERLAVAVTEMLARTTLTTKCPEDFRATLFVAMMHVEANLVVAETVAFTHQLVSPLVKTFDTETQMAVYDVMKNVTKILLQTPMMNEIREAQLLDNNYLDTLVDILRQLRFDILKPESELRTVDALKAKVHSLLMSLNSADDCSLLISRQKMLDLCDRIIARMTSPMHLESALRVLDNSLTPALIKDTPARAYLRDVLEMLTTKYVTIVTYTITSLETLVRTEMRPASLLVDWIYCLTLPAARYSTRHIPPMTWRYPHIMPFLASSTVPPTTPLAKVILNVRDMAFPVVESRRKMDELKHLVWTEVKTLRLPMEADDCYRAKVAATNAVMAAGLHLIDRTLINSTVMNLMEQLVNIESWTLTSKVTPTLSFEIVRNEVTRLTERLLRSEHEAVMNLLDIPEMHNLFTRTKLIELLTTPLSMTTRDEVYRRFMAYYRSANDVITMTRDMCTCDVSAVNARVQRVLKTNEDRLTISVAETEIIEELLTFCGTNGIPMTSAKLEQLLAHARPVLSMCHHHQRHLLTELKSCVDKMTVVPDAIANQFLTLKFKLTDLELLTVFNAPLDFYALKVAFPEVPIHPFWSKVDAVSAISSLNNLPAPRVPFMSHILASHKPHMHYALDFANTWNLSQLKTLPLPSKDMQCFDRKYMTYNALITTMLHEVSVSVLRGFLKERLVAALNMLTPEVSSDTLDRIMAELEKDLITPEHRLLQNLLELPEMKNFVDSARIVTILRAGRPLTFSDLMTSMRADLGNLYTSHEICNLDLTLAKARLQNLLINMDTGVTLEKFERTFTSVFRQRLGTSLPNKVLRQLLAAMRPTVHLCLSERRAICEMVRTDMRTDVVDPTSLISIVVAVEEIAMEKMAFSNIRDVNTRDMSLDELKREIRLFKFPTPADDCFRPKVNALRAVLATFLQQLRVMIVDRTLEKLVELPTVSNIIRDVVSKDQVIKTIKQELSYTAPEMHYTELRRLLDASELMRTTETTRPVTLSMILNALKSDLRTIRVSEYLCRLPLDVKTTYTPRFLNTLETSMESQRIKAQVQTGLRRICSESHLTCDPKFVQTVDSIMPGFVSYSNTFKTTLGALLTSANEDLVTPAVFVEIMTSVRELVADLSRPAKYANTELPFNGHFMPSYPRIGSMELAHRISHEFMPKIETLPLPKPSESCYTQKLAVYHALLVKCLKEVHFKLAKTLVHHLFDLPSFRYLLPIHPELSSALTPETLLPIMDEIMETDNLKALMEVPEVRRILRESTVVRMIKSTTQMTMTTLVSAIEYDLNLIKESRDICNMPVNAVLLNMEDLLTSLNAIVTPEVIQHKMTRCISLACERKGLVIPETDIVMFTSEIKPVIKPLSLNYITIAQVLMNNARAHMLTPQLLCDFTTLLMLIPPTGHEMTPTYSRQLDMVEIERVVRDISLPEETDPCYRQKVTVLYSVLANTMRRMNIDVVDILVNHLLRMPTITTLLNQHPNLHPTMVKQAFKTELLAEFEIEPLRIPELDRFLRNSAIQQMIKSKFPITMPALVSAIKNDVQLIDNAEICDLPVNNVLLNMDKLVSSLTDLLAYDRMTNKVAVCIRRACTQFNVVIPENKIDQIATALKPVMKPISVKYLTTAETLMTNTRAVKLTPELLIDFIGLLQVIPPTGHQMLLPIHTRRLEIPFDIAHIIGDIRLPEVTDSCYNQKVTVFYTILVNAVRHLDTDIIEAVVDHLFHVPSVATLLSQYPNLHPTMMKQALKTEMLSEFEIETLNIAEMDHALQNSAVLKVIKSKSPITIPVLVSAIEEDMRLITKEDICNVPVNNVFLNMDKMTSSMTNLYSYDSMTYKLARCIRRACTRFNVVVPEHKINQITAVLKPVIEPMSVKYVATIEILASNAKAYTLTPELLINFIDLLEFIPLSEHHMLIPVDTRQFDLPVEIIRMIRNIRLPEVTETCYKQKVTVFYTVLAKAMRHLNFADAVAEHLLHVPTVAAMLDQYPNLHPAMLKQTLKTELLKDLEMEHLKIPEVRRILLNSEVLRVIKSESPVAIPTLVSAIKEDLQLIRTSAETCNVPVDNVLLKMDTMITTLTDLLAYDRMSYKLADCIRRTCTHLNIVVPENKIAQVITEIRPIYITMSTKYTALFRNILINARHNVVMPEIVIDLVKVVKLITPFTNMSPAMALYPALTPELIYNFEPMLELPAPTEPCYIEKVLAFQAVLVKSLRNLDSKLVTRVTDALIDVPEIQSLIKRSEYRINHNTIKDLLVKQLVQESQNVQALWEVPELRHLLESSELVRVLHYDFYTLKDIMDAVHSDLNMIRASPSVCNINVRTVSNNMQHFLTSLKSIFAWETVNIKMVDGLRRMCVKEGLRIQDNQITQIVSKVAPVFKHIANDYILVVDILMPQTLNTRINTNILVNILKVVQSLRFMTPANEVILPETVLSELRALNFPGQSDRCYTQKVTVAHVLLVKMIRSLDAQVVKSTVEEIMTPDVLPQLDLHNVRLQTLKRHLVQSILKDIPQAFHNIHEIPELHQLMENTQLVRVLRQQNTLPALRVILSALKSDLFNIRNNNGICDMSTDVINSNMQTLTTNLKNIFLFENMKDKVITGLRDFCRIEGITVSNDRLNQLMLAIRPVYKSHITGYLRVIDLLTPSKLDKIIGSELLVSLLREIANLQQPDASFHPEHTLTPYNTVFLPEYTMMPYNARPYNVVPYNQYDMSANMVPYDMRSYNLPPYDMRMPQTYIASHYSHDDTVIPSRLFPSHQSFQTIRTEIMREIETLTFPQPAEPCYRQKVAAYHVVLVRALRALEPRVMQTTFKTLVHEHPTLFTGLFSRLHITPEALVDRVIRDLVEDRPDISPEMYNLLQVPELRRLLEQSELVRLVISKPDFFTVQTLLKCVRSDLAYIASDNAELCNIQVPNTLVSTRLLINDLKQFFSWKMTEHKLMHTLLNLCNENNVYLTKDDLKELLLAIRPTYDSLTFKFVDVIKTLKATVREQYINRELLADFLAFMVNRFHATMASLINPTMAYNPMANMFGRYNSAMMTPMRTRWTGYLPYNSFNPTMIPPMNGQWTSRYLPYNRISTSELTMDIAKLPLFKPTESCYAQKVSVFRALLVKLVAFENPVFTSLDQLSELPLVRSLIRYGLSPDVIITTMKTTLLRDLDNLRHNMEVPELRHILERSELIRLVMLRTTNMAPQMDLVTALRHDLALIRNEEHVCALPIHTIKTNVETFLTNLKDMFMWETLKMKLESGLLFLCQSQGLSDYDMTTKVEKMVEQMKPVLIKAMDIYTITANSIFNNVHTDQPITPHLIAKILNLAGELLVHHERSGVSHFIPTMTPRMTGYPHDDRIPASELTTKIANLPLFKPTENCYTQKVAVFRALLAKLLAVQNPVFVSLDKLGELPIVRSTLMRYGFSPDIVLATLKTTLLKDLDNLRRNQVPELHQLLEKSELIRLVKLRTTNMAPMTTDLVTALRRDIELIRDERDVVCALPIRIVNTNMESFLNNLKEMFTWETLKLKLESELLRLCQRQGLSDYDMTSKVKQMVGQMKPVLVKAMDAYTTTTDLIIKIVHIDQPITAGLVTKVLLAKESLDDFKPFMINHFNPTMIPQMPGYQPYDRISTSELSTKIANLPLFKPTESCYTQKVAVFRTLLAKLLAFENPVFVSLDKLRELPVVRSTLTRYGFSPEILLSTLKTTLLKDLDNLRHNMEVPELRHILERSELIRLVILRTTNMEPLMTTDLVTALRRDIELIRDEKDVACALPLRIVNTNMETFLNNLKEMFTWETLKMKLESELLGLCQQQGLSDYDMTTEVEKMVEEMKPVLVKAMDAYTVTTDLIFENVRTNQPITPRLIAKVLHSAKEILDRHITPKVPSYSRWWTPIADAPFANRKL